MWRARSPNSRVIIENQYHLYVFLECDKSFSKLYESVKKKEFENFRKVSLKNMIRHYENLMIDLQENL